MNRFGWVVLALFVLAALAFASMIRFRDGAPQPPTSPPAPPTMGDLVIPVVGVRAHQLADTWGDSRGDGSRVHNAIDILMPRGTLVVAAAPGRVEKLFDSEAGGRTIYVRSPDRRTVYYYAHLNAYRAGLAEGQQVRAGEVIGTVGSTGNASPDGPHLHFEIKRMAAGQRWWQGREVNPYPLLAGKASAR